MMFILLGVCFFYKNHSFFNHAQQLPDFMSGMFFRSTTYSNKLIGALSFLRPAFLCNSMQRAGVFNQCFYNWSVVLCQWLKFSGCRSSKIAGVKNRVIVFNFGCSMIALGEKIGGRCAGVKKSSVFNNESEIFSMKAIPKTKREAVSGLIAALYADWLNELPENEFRQACQNFDAQTGGLLRSANVLLVAQHELSAQR